MSTPCIITVAITGSVPTKKDNPAVPVTSAEQVESTHAAFEAGAALVHMHVRNDDGSTTSDPEKFARFLAGIRKHCPGMIVQFSTGGRSGMGKERGGMLHLKPDMASLRRARSISRTIIYENHPTLIEELAKSMLDNDIKPEIEIFDLAMLYNAAKLVQKVSSRRPCTCSSCSAYRMRCRPTARCSISCVAQLEECCRAPRGPRPVSAGINRSQPVGARARRTLPHGTRGQPAHRQGAARREQRRTGAARRGAHGPVRPLGCDAGRSAANPRPARG